MGQFKHPNVITVHGPGTSEVKHLYQHLKHTKFTFTFHFMACCRCHIIFVATACSGTDVERKSERLPGSLETKVYTFSCFHIHINKQGYEKLSVICTSVTLVRVWLEITCQLHC